MCRHAAEDGCHTLIATPHQRHPSWPNEERAPLLQGLERLQAHLGPSPRLLPGAEIRIDDELLFEVDRYPDGHLLPLAGSRYLLLELDRHRANPEAVQVVHELTVAGWYPVIAHPEHYPWLISQPGLVERLAAAGALFQLTAKSLLGGSGRGPQAACAALLDAGLAHFVASDAHGIERRPPGLAEARRALERSWGAEVAEALTLLNPGAVIANQPLPQGVFAR